MDLDDENLENTKPKEKPTTQVHSKDGNVSKEKISISIKQLSGSSTKDVLKSLNYLGRIIERINGINVFHQCGGIKSMIKMLTSTNEDVLNGTLNIIANCCYKLVSNEQFCDELSQNSVPITLTSLLKKTTNVKIQRRICRLVANMAHSHRLARELHKANICIVIIPILNSTKCVEVQQAAVRALRWLWETDKFHYEMLRIGTVKAVATFLEAENEQLLKLVLRTLVVFTQPCSDQTALQICGNGTGYNEIVSKSSLTVVSVLICNLSYSPPARVELSKAGVVQMIIDKLDGGGKIDSYLITALCFLCRESMIRASLRKTPNGFKTLLCLLMNPKAKHFYPELLCALTQFIYDQPSLMIMVKGGLINVLVEKLSEYCQAHGSPHLEAMSSFAPLLSPASSPSSWSSPSPPPPHTPVSDSGMYSPRCSTPPESDIESTESSTNTFISTPKSCSERYSEGQLGVDGCIMEVLSQLTYQGIPLPALASKTTINTFLEYMVGLRFPQSRQNFIKATKALSSIVKCKHYFNMLLEEESILAIERALCRGEHFDCWECKRLEETGRSVLSELGTAAQSGLGEGELTYRLATVSEPIRTTVSLTIPHVIKQPNLLNHLLFGHNALKLLLDALNSRVDEAVPALHNLFTTLAIENPQMPILICQQCEISSMRKESNISFSLDDGSRVLANKESLSHSCPVFEAMFRGGFVESQQSTVHITDMSASCLTHLTRIINEYCSCALPKDLSTLLEMVTATDRFLLPDLTSKILNIVMNSSLSHSTCCDIYEWGVTVGQRLTVTTDIPIHVIKYLLAADMPSIHRVNATKLILNGKHASNFIEDLTVIIKNGLKLYTKNHRFLNYRML